MHIGIDLGTTQSALATFDGETVTVVPGPSGETLTPSVVRVDARGGATAGRRALRFLEADPANTAASFKRLMGGGERLRFAASGRALLPEELAAEVLRSLLEDARQALGFTPRAAVIATPALFELPQNHATAAAGTLAGLDEVVLVAEPIASAIAAGWRARGGEGEDARRSSWMVFDLGGGTLDVSLLETADGRLRVVDHGGDNFLGGKDFDGAVMAWAVAALERGGGRAPDRGTAAGRRAFALLRAACEQAKIDLSRAERAEVAVPELELELALDRAQLEALTAPLVERCVAVVRGVLERNGRAPGEVGRVVLVGGPTAMPAVRARVGALFGGRIAEGVDPMTAVARGAALFAGTVGLDGRPAAVASAAVASAVSAARAPLAVRIEHPAVTADLEPFVVGRFLPGAGAGVAAALPARVWRVWIERDDGGFRSPAVALSAEGSFVLQVELERGRKNQLRLLAVDRAGAAVPLATSAFTIVHGLTVADPPLSRSVGIACADDVTQVYFARGTPLPARRTFVHQTVRPVRAGVDGGSALAIPVVQGESLRAHRNRLIGVLRLEGIEGDLPAGSRVEVTLHLDRSGQLHTRADVPALGTTFEDVVHVLVPTATLATAERELAAARKRADELGRRAFEARLPAAVAALAGVGPLLVEAERTAALARAAGGDGEGDAAGGDPGAGADGDAADAAQKLQRLLLDAGAALDDAEAILAWPELEGEAQRQALFFTPLVAAWGTRAEQELFDQALQAAGTAGRARNAAELERHLEAMRAIGKASYCRDPQSLPKELEWATAHVTQAVDVARTCQLLEQARAAEARGDRLASRTLLSEIWSLLPGSEELQRKSYNSAVR